MDRPQILPSSPPSPSLTQSASNSSSSPPQPSTPPHRHLFRQQRYPADLGRVPLHRRGTSQTYERLEDLLREAGYKETRVFTPESNRLESRISKSNEEGSSDSQAGKKLGMGAAVVGFLTGLVTGVGGGATASRSSSSVRQSSTEDDSSPNFNPDHSQTRSQSPLSPLATRHQHQHLSRRDSSRSIESSEPHTPFMTSSYESIGEPTPKPRLLTSSQFHQYQQQQPVRRLSAAQRSLQKQASKSSIATTNQDSLINVIHQPRPSLAGTYLRHMVSTPDIPVRPNSTPVHSRIRALVADGDSNSNSNANSEDNNINPNNNYYTRDESQPPLPKKWLDTVARAVLFGGGNLGGPNSSTTKSLMPNQDTSSSYRTLRSTRSSLSQTTLARSSKRPNNTTRRSGLADHTNPSSLSPLPPLQTPPPALFMKIERGRSTRSESQVTKTLIVCRSAPGSRSSSISRVGGTITPNSHSNPYKLRHHASYISTRRDNKEKDDQKRERNKIKTKTKTNKTKTKKGKGRSRNEGYDRLRVPSLSRTRVECDGWYGYVNITTPIPPLSSNSTSTSNPTSTLNSTLNSPLPLNSSSSSSSRQHQHQQQSQISQRYHPTTINITYNTDFSQSPSHSSSECDSTSSDEEDEGELNLAKMLVHPKRQHSIRSLRKHLTNPPCPNAHNGPNATSNIANTSRLRLSLGGTDSTAHGLRGRKSNLAQMQEDGEGLEWDQNWQRGGFGRRTSEDDEEEVQGFNWLRHERGSTRSTSGLHPPNSGN